MSAWKVAVVGELSSVGLMISRMNRQRLKLALYLFSRAPSFLQFPSISRRMTRALSYCIILRTAYSSQLVDHCKQIVLINTTRWLQTSCQQPIWHSKGLDIGIPSFLPLDLRRYFPELQTAFVVYLLLCSTWSSCSRLTRLSWLLATVT